MFYFKIRNNFVEVYNFFEKFADMDEVEEKWRTKFSGGQ